MKKWIYSTAVLLVGLSLQSCLHDNEEVFDKPASQRLTETINNQKALLESQSNGWVMHYYTGKKYTGFGTTMLIRFANGKAEATGELTEGGKVSRSAYDILRDQGSVLTFNTFNEAMHQLAQPYRDDVDGDQGDYEFVIMRTTQDSVFVQGRKWGNKMLLTRMPENTTWDVYLDNLNKLSRQLPSIFNVMADNRLVGKLRLSKSRKVEYTDDKGNSSSTLFSLSDKGIVLAESLEVNGRQVQYFTFDGEELTLTPLHSALTDTKFEGVLTPDFILDKLESTTISMDNAGGETTVQANKLNKFTITTDADWFSVNKGSDALTITVTPNTTGKFRHDRIKVEAGGETGYISVVQGEAADLVGDYTLTFIKKGKEETYTAGILQENGQLYISIVDGAAILKWPATYNAATASLEVETGSLMGVVYNRYYIFPIFLDEKENEWTGFKAGVKGHFTFGHLEDGTLMADFSGQNDAGAIMKVIYVYACLSNSFTNANGNGAGIWNSYTAPKLVKK